MALSMLLTASKTIKPTTMRMSSKRNTGRIYETQTIKHFQSTTGQARFAARKFVRRDFFFRGFACGDDSNPVADAEFQAVWFAVSVFLGKL